MRTLLNLLLVIPAFLYAETNRAPLDMAFSEPVTANDALYTVPIMMVKASSSCSSNERIITRCTATRIAENYVATAGHCANNTESIYIWHDHEKLQELIPKREPSRCRPMPEISEQDAIKVEPSHIESSFSGQLDLAVLRAEGITQEIVTPIAHSKLPSALDTFTLIGFGVNDCYEEVTRFGEPYIVKNSSLSDDYSFGKASYKLSNSASSQSLRLTSTTEAFTCNGDSGTGVLARMDNAYRLLGVHTASSGGQRKVGALGGMDSYTQNFSHSRSCALLRRFQRNVHFEDFDISGWCSEA